MGTLLAWLILLVPCLSVRGGGGGGGGPSSASYRGTGSGWIQDFCGKTGNEFFAEVPESFVRERMNSIDIGRGINIPYMEEALAVILGERRINIGEESVVQSSAELLYGLLHARFLVSPAGLKCLLDMFSKAAFGRCPRVYCQGQAVLPVGETDRPMQSSVKVFCPRCHDLFFPGYVRACDGAFWGTSAYALLLVGWPELKTSPNTAQFVPRVFGFKVHQLGAG